ncbi:MAG: 2-phosphosulfolactate phosphatase [Candidatus Bathyarchaeia archaeon]
MAVKVSLEFVARDADKAVKRRDIIVVIDVLRFGSSSLNALVNGAEAIIPVRTLDEAYELHKKYPSFLLAGERRGLKPERFELGNSPLEFTREKVYGKTIIYTTTSGTMALTRSKAAKWVLMGAFLNAHSAACKAIEIADKEGIDISLVQSGAKGEFSLEDFVCAGAIIECFPREKVELSDGALAALSAFKQMKSNLCENIMQGKHARYLINLGFEKDIKFSCQPNLFSLVPIYRNGVIKIVN